MRISLQKKSYAEPIDFLVVECVDIIADFLFVIQLLSCFETHFLYDRIDFAYKCLCKEQL